ncbi:LacI family DNA-binding transcriptional regulator [Changpingibacter yushuensis]|uniref:LacI family DNA-binding transcriptional regulator n=1 Tax=Changpingibacter yushuensis TaxID=2758440 RepID=UPI00165DEAF2|nr:LacI family DNA-binding transcriptional regulator [Changpingibacter yushuensis]
MTKHIGTDGRVTLDDIAAASGYSKATVSKALNNRSDVSARTKLIVRRAAQDLEYNGKKVAPTILPNVAVITDTFDTLYTLQILNGAVRECSLRGYAMTSSYLTVDAPKSSLKPLSRRWLEAISSLDYIGLVLVTTAVPDHLVDDCLELDVPITVIDPTNRPRSDVYSISATNWNGGLDATKYLLDLGHQKIAFVGGPPESLPSIERHQGYLSALRMAGITPDPDLTTGTEFTFESGLAAAKLLQNLPAGRRPTSFFAGSDWSAVGVIEGVRRAGLRVPQDVSVVGFDDTALASSFSPPLTTIYQPLRDMGSAAVRALSDLRSGMTPTAPMMLNTHLVIRDSTAQLSH